jgi:hypothetical protein
MAEDLENRIAELEGIIKRLSAVEVKKPSLWDKVKYKLSEQGTQRGLMLLIPMLLISWFGIEKDTAVEIVTGVIALASAHDIVTEG